MTRLFMLSNRIPTDETPARGLIAAVHDCLVARGGVWVGSADTTVDDASPTLDEIGHNADFRLTFNLGYANSVLWPLFHGRGDLIDLDADHAAAHRAVNVRVDQDPADPGVLVLAHFAGAAEQLQYTLQVNPHDIEDMAKAIHRALPMPLKERRDHHKDQMSILRRQDISWWTDTFLETLAPSEPIPA